MSRPSILLLVVLASPLLGHSPVRATDDDDKIVGVWERETEKDGLEETWVIKKTKDKWSVSGTFWKRGKNGEIGNFKGKDVSYADGDLTFTQDYFKLPKGRENGTKITASAEGDRLDFSAKKDGVEIKDTMRRAGDATELFGTWTAMTLGMKESWTIEKNKSGALSVHGTFKKGDQVLGSFTGVNVRYFKRTLWFNQEFDKLPSKNMVNGSPIACVGQGGELHYLWSTGKQKGKAKLTLENK